MCFITASGKQYALLKVWTYGAETNWTTLEKDVFQVLMNSFKNFVVLNENNSISFIDKVCNHTFKNKLQVVKISLLLLEWLIMATNNILEWKNSRVAKVNIPAILHHHITSYGNKDRITQIIYWWYYWLTIECYKKMSYFFCE